MGERRERITLDCPVGSDSFDRRKMLRVAESFATTFIDRKAHDLVVYELRPGRHAVVWWTEKRAIVARLEVTDG